MEIEEIEKRLKEFEKKLKPVPKGVFSPEQLEDRKAARLKAEKTKQKKYRRIEKLKGRKILEGIAASPGLAVGRVMNVHEQVPELMSQIKPGNIIVADRLRPEHDVYMKKAAGYIMNTEGRTSSVAIMAREWETPTITGTIGEGEESTQLLKTGQRVIVDGTVGAVFEHVKERSKFCLDLGIEEFSAYKASENVAGLIKALKFAKSQLFKTEAIDILVKIGSPKVVKSLAAILRDEKEADEARPNTAKALGKIASDGAIIALMTTLGDWFGVIREGVSQVLAEVGEPAIVPLISALNSGNPFAQEGAANALFSIGTSDYRIELFNAVLEIKTEEGFRLEDAKKNAIEGLVKIADKKAVESLIAVVENIKEDSEIREKAVHALGKIKDSRAVEVLISAATEDADYSIRCWSASALGDIGDIRAVEALLALLQDKIGRQEMRLRGHAAEALGKIGDNRILEPFIKVLEDNREHEFVRRCAAWSLLQLDDDRAALPLIKYFKKNLDAVSNLKPLQYDISKSVGDTT